MKKTRVFAALFAGNMFFFLFYAGLAWALAFFNVTPYGRFVAAFFKGRTREAANGHIAANRALFDSMMKDAASFANLALTPLAGFLMGVLVGAILSENRKLGVIWSVVAAAPVSVLFLVKSGSGPATLPYLALLLAATALGGLLGGSLKKKGPEEAPHVDA